MKVKEIPGWMLELSQQLNSQSNRCTSHPFWQVRCKKHICAPEGYSDKFEIIKYDDCCGVVYRSDKHSTEDLFDAIDLDFKIQYSINHYYWEGSDRAKPGEEQLFENLVIEFFDLTFDPAEDDLPQGFDRVYLQEIEEIVWTGLTEVAANEFIRRKQHDYPALYTYVESACMSPQFSQLIEWVKSISEGQS